MENGIFPADRLLVSDVGASSFSLSKSSFTMRFHLRMSYVSYITS